MTENMPGPRRLTIRALHAEARYDVPTSSELHWLLRGIEVTPPTLNAQPAWWTLESVQCRLQLGEKNCFTARSDCLRLMDLRIIVPARYKLVVEFQAHDQSELPVNVALLIEEGRCAGSARSVGANRISMAEPTRRVTP